MNTRRNWHQWSMYVWFKWKKVLHVLKANMSLNISLCPFASFSLRCRHSMVITTTITMWNFLKILCLHYGWAVGIVRNLSCNNEDEDWMAFWTSNYLPLNTFFYYIYIYIYISLIYNILPITLSKASLVIGTHHHLFQASKTRVNAALALLHLYTKGTCNDPSFFSLKLTLVGSLSFTIF